MKITNFKNINFKKLLLIIGCIPLAAILFYFLFRNVILHKIIENKVAYYKAKKHVNLAFNEINFAGISGIKASNLSVASIGVDTLLQAKNLFFHVRLLPLFIGKIRIDEIEVENSNIIIYKNDSVNNYSFLIKKSVKKDSVKTVVSNNLADIADNLLDNIFDNIPSKISIKNTRIFATIDSAKVNWLIPEMNLMDGNFSSTAKITENNKVVDWSVNATINKGNRSLDLKLFHANNPHASLPFLMSLFKMKCGFDTLKMSIENAGFEEDNFCISGNASISNVAINHWRIAPNDVQVKNAELQYKIFFGEHNLGIDSTTTCAINNIVIHPYFNYSLSPTKTLQLHVDMPNCEAQTFFTSLPKGLFSTIEGIEAKGDLAYKLRFNIDTEKPDSLEFFSTIIPTKFKITKYGQSNLAKMNDEFLYTAYENNMPMSTFHVGPSNPDFAALEQISPYLRNAVLVSEDGDFFWHKGFNENAFRKSIATNFKEKKFKRGGSTISMQLVKNVFLTRKKTIARKLEEALIVWLIENNRITSKERMYEVYLNVIEWGPGVYGATEASRYYFNKKANELSLSESIFLAMIVPRPKYFYWQFDEDGKLKSHTEGYFKLIANHLLRREIITEDEKNNFVPSINLVGIAKEKLKIRTDSIPSDSLQLMIEVNE